MELLSDMQIYRNVSLISNTVFNMIKLLAFTPREKHSQTRTSKTSAPEINLLKQATPLNATDDERREECTPIANLAHVRTKPEETRNKDALLMKTGFPVDQEEDGTQTPPHVSSV